MLTHQQFRLLALLLALAVLVAPAAAVTVNIDYTYDSNNFFGAGNPQGATAGMQAKAALESAAGFFSNILNDTLSSIQTPPTFVGQFGQWSWKWTMDFNHPATGDLIGITNPTVPADQYIIYAGARSLAGSTVGIGGPGGSGWSSTPTGGFTAEEGPVVEAIDLAFINAVETRGETSGFANWGGVITFDRDGSTTWHYNHTTQPSGNVTDFFSVAIHELGHSLGFGTSSEFQSLISGSNFIGANAESRYGGPVPLSGNGHWAFGTSSVVYGTATAQETAMDPDLLNGTRKRFTELDAAALKDIGWEVIPLPGLPGDYNGNGTVDAADYVLWRNTLGQNVAAGSGADGSGNGTIGNEDYTYWRTRFGNVAGSGASVNGFAAQVPEPTSGLLAVLVCSASLVARRRPPLWRRCR